MLQLKLCSSSRESHPAFMSNWSTIICTLLALPTHCHWMSSCSRKRERGVIPRFHLVVFVYGVNQEN